MWPFNLTAVADSEPDAARSGMRTRQTTESAVETVPASALCKPRNFSRDLGCSYAGKLRYGPTSDIFTYTASSHIPES